jgi:nitrogen regulatory protein PII
VSPDPARVPLHRVTAVVDHSRIPGGDVSSVLHLCGIPALTSQPGRSFMLGERKGLQAALGGELALHDWRVAVVTVLTDEVSAPGVVVTMHEVFGLGEPGRGSVFVETLELLGRSDYAGIVRQTTLECAPLRLQSDLVGICCIVQRGQGESIARASLASAACVPHVTFGTGAGLRDKLGLLRVTIPADKELVHLVTSRSEALTVMAMLVLRGQLDLPGRGFIYLYPIEQGAVNRHVRGKGTGHAASMDQLVAAVDELMGNTGWRSHSQKERGVLAAECTLRNMVELSVFCDEGASEELVSAALNAGAGGATLGEVTASSLPGTPGANVSPAREQCGMVVERGQVARVMEALENAGLYGESTRGMVLVRPVPQAFSYRAPSRNGRSGRNGN